MKEIKINKKRDNLKELLYSPFLNGIDLLTVGTETYFSTMDTFEGEIYNLKSYKLSPEESGIKVIFNTQTSQKEFILEVKNAIKLLEKYYDVEDINNELFIDEELDRIKNFIKDYFPEGFFTNFNGNTYNEDNIPYGDITSYEIEYIPNRGIGIYFKNNDGKIDVNNHYSINENKLNILKKYFNIEELEVEEFKFDFLDN